ncbi:MAG: DUF445 domain-containing protein, partial [Ignavibacteriaceae bacterium]|nr:DUF445 domain-containing protein [Ignavibacteriaceae bacterium]
SSSLKRMKVIATLLLAFFAGLFIILKIWGIQEFWVLAIIAFSEAAVVGAMADWFAITALFRHPLGIPIPHTAILPKKKDQLGENLGSYVQDNFLNKDAIINAVRNYNPAASLGEKMLDESFILQTTTQMKKLLTAVVGNLKKEEYKLFVINYLNKGLKELDFSVVLASIVDYINSGEKKQEYFSAFYKGLYDYFKENYEEIIIKISDEIPIPAIQIPWGKGDIRRPIAKYVADKLEKFLVKAMNDENHESREMMDKYLSGLADKMKNSPDMKEKINSVKENFVNSEKFQGYVDSMWERLTDSILEDLNAEDSIISTKLKESLESFGEKLRTDGQLESKINSFVEDAATGFLDNNSNQIKNLISDKVKNWDTKEFTDNLEVRIGKDLQYIRINGTVIGGLIGLIIFLFSHFVF